VAMEVPCRIVIIDIFCPQSWRLLHLLSEEILEFLLQRLLLRSETEIQYGHPFLSVVYSKPNDADADCGCQWLVSHIVSEPQLGILYLAFASPALKLKIKLVKHPYT